MADRVARRRKSKEGSMRLFHVVIGLGIAVGLSACEAAFSGPSTGQIAFITDDARAASALPPNEDSRETGDAALLRGGAP